MTLWQKEVIWQKMEKLVKTYLEKVKRNGNVHVLCKASDIVVVDGGVDIIGKSGKYHHICILVDIMGNQLVKTFQIA